MQILPPQTVDGRTIRVDEAGKSGGRSGGFRGSGGRGFFRGGRGRGGYWVVFVIMTRPMFVCKLHPFNSRGRWVWRG